MAALAASVPPWIPEDDLLLKNAVEAGASLEALAKGAVRFSRKFTFRELRDRWYSLLYDPIISAEASARMMEFELSVPNSKVSSEVSVKRKLESVRRLYYAMRKKTCNRGDSPGLSLLSPPDTDNITFDSPVQGGIHVSGGHNQTRSGFGRNETALSHPLPENSPPFRAEELPSPLAMWETVEDISAHAMPIRLRVEEKGQEEPLINGDDVELDGNKMILSEMNVIHSGAMLQDKNATSVLSSSTAISESDYAELSESLLNFVNEDQLLLVDTEGEDPVDKSCDYSILASCPVDVHGNEPDVNYSQTLVSDESTIIPVSTGPKAAGAEGSHCGDVGQHGHFYSEISVASSTSTANMESFDGETECVLNSEDPEIPCNDGVILPKQFTSSIMGSKKTSYPFYSNALNLKAVKQEKCLMRKEENPAGSLIASQIKGSKIMPQTSQGHQHVGYGVKGESRNDTAFSQASNAERDASRCITSQTTLTSAAVEVPKMEALHVCNNPDQPLCESGSSIKQDASVSEADPIMLNQEESESDDGIPSCSEIEAMILGMDLCPDDSDSYINREVSRYQNEDTRRTIIRLEQCAQASIQRSIASRGALAVLYGCHLKHYIRETEVILGRATEDMEIDIDLGREGPVNKISRRQALIKMEANGLFILKNLGKSQVFLNGKEVATGQSTSLRSGGLIEIGEMAFVFETNSKCVQQRLVNAAKNRQQNFMKFEWSEGVS